PGRSERAKWPLTQIRSHSRHAWRRRALSSDPHVALLHVGSCVLARHPPVAPLGATVPTRATTSDGPLRIPPDALADRGAVRDLGPDVPDLPGDPEPGRAASRTLPNSRNAGAHQSAVGVRQADLRPVPEDD